MKGSSDIKGEGNNEISTDEIGAASSDDPAISSSAVSFHAVSSNAVSSSVVSSSAASSSAASFVPSQKEHLNWIVKKEAGVARATKLAGANADVNREVNSSVSIGEASDEMVSFCHIPTFLLYFCFFYFGYRITPLILLSLTKIKYALFNLI